MRCSAEEMGQRHWEGRSTERRRYRRIVRLGQGGKCGSQSGQERERPEVGEDTRILTSRVKECGKGDPIACVQALTCLVVLGCPVQPLVPKGRRFHMDSK